MKREELIKRLEDLRSRQATVIGEMRELIERADKEDRAITDDEKVKWESLKAEVGELKSTISREQTQLDLETDQGTPRRQAPRPDVRSGEPQDAATVLDLTPADRCQYSIVRACRAYDRGRWDAAPFEFECHEALQKHHKRDAVGFFVPTEALLIEQRHHDLSDFEVRHYLGDLVRALRDGVETRDIGKVAPTTFGAALVATDLLSGSFIDLLRNRTLAAQLGATILPGLVGDVDIPRQSAGAVGGWIATEGGTAGEDELETDTVTLTPRTVAVITDITRRMLKQSSIGIEALVRRDLQMAIGLAIDLGAINGSGAAGQPTGILQTAGIGVVVVAASLDWGDIVEFETDVSVANADIGALAFAVTAAIRGIMKTTEAATNTGIRLMALDGTSNGYNVGVTNQLPAGDMIFGNWNDLLIGEWGGLDMLADPFSLGTSGGLRIHAFQDVDIALRHVASFSSATDATG